MSEENKLIAERRAKITQWESAGFAPYAQKFDRTHTAAEAREFCGKTKLRDAAEIMEKPKPNGKLCGRIVNFRSMGKLAFLKMRDASGDFQICFAKNVLGDAMKNFEKILDLGDFCGFDGEFFLTKHGEPTLLATEIFPLAKSLRPLPEKWHGIADREACYRQRYLDLMTNDETFERFQIRSKIIRMIRDFLHAKDFVEVETRTLQPQAGGAMAKVFETHHNALDQEFVLRIALELEHKMLLAGRFERVFEIGKCFRNEGMDPSHLQEFTMLEWYAAYADLEKNMNWTQEMIQKIVPKVLGTTKCSILDKNEKPVEIEWAGDWPRVKFGDLLKKYAKIDLHKITIDELRIFSVKNCELPKSEAAKMSRGNLLDHVYKKTARPNLVQPTFVTDWPTDLKPLARPNGDGTSDVYQLLVAGWEIVNSYGELIDPSEQRRLLEEQSAAKKNGDEEAMEIDEDFLTAMEHGFPPMTGFGMGIDRFVALITGQPNLRDVVLFPLMRPEQEKLSAKAEEK
ncbi:lysine--tRNA ligase [bacterium]|jgi:lysyl-tRNA synthetase, class II|nr:lysine--tRNA ligase [bacterium]MBT6831686.1 lysine--tRNA ligase [bacterium]MBT6996666.1 lysine--tRNA ligase [bacterium]MBT7772835.1 lysine--tRNA ligase [bacterium]